MMERKTATAFERGAHSPLGTPLASQDALATLPKPLDGSVVSARQLTALTDEDVELTPTESSSRIKEQPMPPLDLRMLERQDSSATSDSSVDDSEGSSESDEEEVVSYGVNGELSPDEFLIKPMPMLPVCPMDDLVVEEEKRRRRSVRMMKKDMHCPDAECLPSPTSQLVPTPRRFTTSQIASGSDVARTPLSAPLLRRDSMAIRQQYWKQLGLIMSRRDLERNTGRRRERHVGVKVQLNDTRSKKGESKSIFQIIASWYASNDKIEDKEPSIGAASDTDSTASTTDSSVSPRRKSIRFCEEAELFYIPLHKDYSKRQRDCMWHTRTEFISMVERNLEEVYDEMEREYEEQLQAEMAENDAMAQEEARQRAYEAQMQARAVSRAKASPTRATPTASPVSSPPMLALCPIATQIKVTPRARSPHDIRFKYLKHLGINN